MEVPTVPVPALKEATAIAATMTLLEIVGALDKLRAGETVMPARFVELHTRLTSEGVGREIFGGILIRSLLLVSAMLEFSAARSGLMDDGRLRTIANIEPQSYEIASRYKVDITSSRPALSSGLFQALLESQIPSRRTRPKRTWNDIRPLPPSDERAPV